MRVTFDSNAWERIFDSSDVTCAPIRDSLKRGAIRGFIGANSFRIEAIRKRDRPDYFAEPYLNVHVGSAAFDGQPHLRMSIGPDDRRHPGLHSKQAEKLQRALSAGILLMYGCNWMGLPEPPQLLDRTFFVSESPNERKQRERRHYDVFFSIKKRGVGMAAFDAAGGWSAFDEGVINAEKLSSACAEWADGELVASHIAYGNDILCTEDRARNAGVSVFDLQNRNWLTNSFNVVFKTIDELIPICSQRMG